MLIAAVAGCAPPDDTLTVGFAASLTDVAPLLAAAFEAEHPGNHVEVTIAGSGVLVAQALAGAPFDVVVAADATALDPLAQAALISEQALVASNAVVIAVRPGLPQETAIADDLVIAVCAAAQPCGRAAESVRTATGEAWAPDLYLADVRAVAGALASGDADAGVVFATDAAALGLVIVDTPDVPPALVTAASMAGTNQTEASALFLEFLASDAAQQILRDAGFAAVPAETK